MIDDMLRQKLINIAQTSIDLTLRHSAQAFRRASNKGQGVRDSRRCADPERDARQREERRSQPDWTGELARQARTCREVGRERAQREAGGE